MSNKNNENQEINQQLLPYEDLLEENNQLRNQLEEKTKQLESSQDKYNQALKTAAYMQNLYNQLKDQAPKDLEKSQKKIKLDFFHQIIKFIDMLEVALQQMEQSSQNNINSIIEGVQMVYNYILNSMENNFKLKKINCKIGDNFDYNIHEAQQQIKGEPHLNNTIAKVISYGYEYNGEIIRSPIVDVYIS
jgi:molecular chaperone GrpE (heat shock protein)